MTGLSGSMKAIVSKAEGQLADETMPIPTPGAGEVLVKVAVSGVNPVDYKAHGAGLPFTKERPYIPGCDLAGTVAAVGPDVTRFKVGDEVFGMTGSIAQGPQGTLAEYAIAWEPMLAKKPTNLTMRQAAAFPLALLTAWEGMMDRHTVKATDYVLVTGASGGVGHLCLQMAALKGAKVFGLASADKRDIVERYGGTFVDYKAYPSTEALLKALRELTPNGNGFDVVYDVLGMDWVDHALELLAPHGYMAELGAFGPTPVANGMMKGASIALIIVLLPFTTRSKKSMAYYGQMLEDSLPFLADGSIKIEMDDVNRFTFSKDGVEDCYKCLQSGKNRGKLVIDIIPQ